jgi:5-methylcytosine-specific restriction protein A
MKTLRPQLQTVRSTLRTVTTRTQRTTGSALMKTRERIFARDMGMCQCGDCKALGRIRLAEEVDHIVPLWAGGLDVDENRQAINGECHKAKSAAEAAQRARGLLPGA